jgi:hypothetical protein
MLVQEQHLRIDIELQKLNSHLYDNIDDYTKDVLLTIAQYDLVRARTSRDLNHKQEGAQDTNKRYEDISNLMRIETLPVYKFDDIRRIALLPDDFFIFDSSLSNTVYDCKGLSKNEISSPIYYSLLKMSDTPSPSHYGTYRITFTNNTGTYTLFDAATTPLNNGFNLEAEKFILINYIIDYVNQDLGGNGYGIKIYWERFEKMYKPNTFIIIVDSTVLNVDSSITGAASISSSVLNFPYFSMVLPQNKKETTCVNRLNKSLDNRRLLTKSFGKSKYSSPCIELYGKSVLIYVDDKFDLSSLELTYIKRPSAISLQLNQSCELSFPDEVVSHAVKLISSYIESGNLQQIINSNSLKE